VRTGIGLETVETDKITYYGMNYINIGEETGLFLQASKTVTFEGLPSHGDTKVAVTNYYTNIWKIRKPMLLQEWQQTVYKKVIQFLLLPPKYLSITSHKQTKNNSVALSPRANYTD
jgi:hypothetical protein